MRAQRILGVTVASVVLAMSGMFGATTAQAGDLGHRPNHCRCHHKLHLHKLHLKLHLQKLHLHKKCHHKKRDW